VNWSHRARFGNCTFAGNAATGIGGGLYCAYDSQVDVIDSIFWANNAAEGESIAVGTNERPSALTISFSDVEYYPSVNAIYVESPSILDPVSTVFNANPVFRKLPGSELGNISADYYLDQLLSPCKDRGSDNSIDKGLFNYTTSIDGIQDKGKVDLGYHYESLLAREFCSYVDMDSPANGRIDLSDWAIFASWWLEGSCKEGGAILGGNNWCGGADMNFNSYIDSEDLLLFASCWLNRDTEAPTPNPAEWG
jgi:hypothetical protein